jgi:hypothetical protein
MEEFTQVEVKMQVDIQYSHVAWSEKRDWKGPEEFLASLKEYQKARKIK